MAQTPEDDGDQSKLELPSLSIFRRRKKKSDGDASDDTGTETAEHLAELGSEADEPDVNEPVEEPGTEVSSEDAEAAGQAAAEPRLDAAPEEAVAEPRLDAPHEETQPIEPVEPIAETSVEADAPPVVVEADPEPVVVEADAPPVVVEADPEPATGEPVGTILPDAEPTQVLPTGDQEGDAHEVHEVAAHDEEDTSGADQETAGAAGVKEPRQRRELSLPALDGKIAAPITGAVVGLAGVALTFIGQSGCKAVRGTSSCGGVGLFLLIAILALMVLFGAALLKAWHISDPTNSSFLAVGLVAVLAMLFFLPSIDRWFMVVVIPVLTALTYLLSWWVTHTFIESADET